MLTLSSEYLASCHLEIVTSKIIDREFPSWFLVGFVHHWATTGTPRTLFFKCVYECARLVGKCDIQWVPNI